MFSRTTRILLVAALLAGGAYFLFSRLSNGPDSDDALRLVNFDIGRVDGIVLKRETDTLRFAREDSLWRMTEPVPDRAEYSTIRSLLNALDHAEIARDLGATDDPTQFGLDPPQTMITLLTGTDTTLAVALGKRSVDDAWCYARIGTGANLLLVPTDIARSASLPRDAYRDQRVVDFQLREVGRYVLTTDAHGTTWIRRESGWVSQPFDGDAIVGDSVAVETVLRRLRGLRAAEFLDGDAPLPVDATEGSIQLWRPDNTLLAQVSFHHVRDARWIVSNSLRVQAMVIDDDVSDLFQHTTNSLRDRRLIQFSPPDAERIEVVLPDVQGEIVRTGGVWAFPNPAMGRIDPERAADFVRALRALKWTDVAQAADLEATRFSITVTGAGGTILDQMRAGPRSDGTFLVTSRSTRATWTIDRELLDALAATFARLKAP